ncbi:MAG: DUF6691 family protein [Candidatus Latescibacterota bacterium]|nr:DUF6691 family protein [Candidatus Latescibacterota bacterium]
MKALSALPIGVFFGIVLVKSEVASWFRIQAMFRFQEAHMYLVMSAAVVVGLISVQIIRRLGIVSLAGPISYENKDFTWGTVIGGAIFGIGWAITGACPGPVYAQVGSGEAMALATFAGVFSGAYLYAWLQPRLPH